MSILTCFFLALIPYAASITFKLTNITPLNSLDIKYEGDAACTSDAGIQLTKESNSEGSAGRVAYSKRLHLWDKSSYLACFSTRFSFVIESSMSEGYADGLTFFLAEDKYSINYGGAMGLPFDVAANES
ncbi:putative legume lectin domain, concanavalin A-like lectin/glucanase domain superfamily [Helianthus annuus]|nr:putative legume lectin domain, concanavalin A-like lectin/glucanase domain superfamily [Helianthus annuus]